MDANKAGNLPRRLSLVLLLLLVSSLLTACSNEMSDVVVEMAIDWAAEKNFFTCEPAGDPDCEVGINWVEIGFYQMGWGSDPNVQAAFDTANTVNSINNADALADEGFATGDPSLIEQAIDARPNDWSYSQQLSILHLTQGNEQAASDAELEAEEKAQAHLDATLREEGLENSDAQAHAACVSTYSNLYRQREDALLAQIDQDPNAENIDYLISQLDLVRSRISQLVANAGNNPCAGYGQ